MTSAHENNAQTNEFILGKEDFPALPGQKLTSSEPRGGSETPRKQNDPLNRIGSANANVGVGGSVGNGNLGGRGSGH